MNPKTDSATAAALPAIAAPAPRQRWRGALWLWLLLLLGLVAAGVGYVGQRAAPKTGAGAGAGAGGAGRGAASLAVTVGEGLATLADVPVYIDALGTVTPLATVALVPQVSGVLTQVLFTEGQLVKKGQLLAQIDPRAYQQALRQAQGTRQRDQAQLESARITLQRYQTLLAQDSIARQEVDSQAALVRQLEGTLAAGRAGEQAAQLSLDFTRMTAPISGRVGLRTVDAGNLVAAGGSSGSGGIASITQMVPMDVQFSVPQDRVPEIVAQTRVAQPGLPVTALDRTRSTVLEQGLFSTLDNQVDVQTGTVRAKARFANATGALFPNQFVNARLLLRTIAQATVVPVSALRTGAQGDFVYAIQADQTVSVRLVQRGQATVDVVQILSGLQPGERVVTEGGDRLKDGASVRLAADAAKEAAGGAMGAMGVIGAIGAIGNGPRAAGRAAER